MCGHWSEQTLQLIDLNRLRFTTAEPDRIRRQLTAAARHGTF
jgi:hypothetical protein